MGRVRRFFGGSSESASMVSFGGALAAGVGGCLRCGS